jgi:hypothetical protein
LVTTGFHSLTTQSLLPVTSSRIERSKWKHRTPCHRKHVPSLGSLLRIHEARGFSLGPKIILSWTFSVPHRRC